MKSALLAFATGLALANTAVAQGSNGPQQTPLPAATPAPQDIAYPGLIKLNVDATDIDRRIFRIRETIPVAQPGQLTLLYPQWLPGNHAPRGPLRNLAGVVFRIGGKVIPWTRDPVDVFAFHLDIPPGASAVDVEFEFLSAVAADEGRIVMTPEMLSLQWNAMALYPAGYFARRIMVEPSARFPDGWTPASALEISGTDGGLTHFKPVDLETLVDSPMVAGRYAKSFDLDPGGPARVTLDVVADRPELLEATPAQVEIHRELIRQAYKLYGSHHYNHYDFLFSLSDHLGGIGLEHHRSSEDGSTPDYFIAWSKNAAARDLLAHEYTHSWNGKFRRPADLWTPNYNVSMRGSLLWVYEGQTQYWGFVLSGRSGLLTRQEALDALAATAATYDTRKGREWRPVEDTTEDPVIAARQPIPWTSWQRSEDYYSEGQLVWLDVDTLIRQRSNGRRSLDDFAKGFLGVENGSWTPLTYTFADVVAALDRVEPYDWAKFLNERINQVAPKAPLDGLTRGGWKLVYTDTPTDYFRSTEGRRKWVDLTYSLGLILGREGEVMSVLWDGPAFKAGLTIGAKIIAVDGFAYDSERLKASITTAKTGSAPVALLVKRGDRYSTIPIEYHGGLRYPRLERLADTPDLLSAIYAKK